jgi:hypothetical protein
LFVAFSPVAVPVNELRVIQSSLSALAVRDDVVYLRIFYRHDPVLAKLADGLSGFLICAPV